MATLSISIRYLIYGLYSNVWAFNSTTFYSMLFSYTCATLVLFVFGIIKSVALRDYISKFIDFGRIRENRIRAEKFKQLTAEKHNASNALKVYSYDCGLILSLSLILVTMTSGTKVGLLVSASVTLFNL
jgi:hypothetical protein